MGSQLLRRWYSLAGQWGMAVLLIQAMSVVFPAEAALGGDAVTFALPPLAFVACLQRSKVRASSLWDASGGFEGGIGICRGYCIHRRQPRRPVQWLEGGVVLQKLFGCRKAGVEKSPAWRRESTPAVAGFHHDR